MAHSTLCTVLQPFGHSALSIGFDFIKQNV